MTVRRVVPGLTALGVVVGLLAAPEAQAEDFFSLSPKPLSRAHAKWDRRDDCEVCHKIGGGVTNQLCLDCHDHQPLAKAIAKKRGLHATFGDKPCNTCHAEHRGRAAQVTDWSKVGGLRRFDHDRTGFSLVGQHDRVPCTKCHLKKLRSGRTSYLGLSTTCDGCHGNTHELTNRALAKNCEACHPRGGGSAAKMTAATLPFDHAERTGTRLDAKHAKAKCADCHERGIMSMSKKRSCAGCHEQPHGRTFRRSDCKDCHGVTAAFTASSFSHDETRFKLRGKHDKPNCSRCHKSLKKPPDRRCAGCHDDPHRKRFEGKKCKTCHGLGGLEAQFDHGRHTEFALTGKHEKLDCRSCHRGKGPRRFEKLADSTCRGCHAHEKAHDGEFDDKQCAQCHAEGGSTRLVFDHDKDARFALTGFHEELECKACHTGSKFRIEKLECRQCHEDSHDGQLGDDCKKCHSTDTKLADTEKVFDHDRLTAFPLVGLHEKAKCEGCHEGRVYAIGEKRCVDCHADDDPHQTALGDDCAKCHEPAEGAPKFDHAVLTPFPLTGKHLVTDCGYCHVMKKAGEPPPAVGWTANLEAPAPDPRYVVRGSECAECHFDPHEGAYGTSCDSCHDTTTFANANRAVHDTGAFRLLGTHDRLACQRCHLPRRQLAGLGTYCVGCHRNDDIHANALGPFCGDCHAQFDWRPARFNHAQVGFALLGAHRTTECRDCHIGGRYVGTPRECETCHMPDAMAAQRPPHGPEMMDCQRCHEPIAFVPARPVHPWWPLEGQHAAAVCESCHMGGVYGGTPRDCEGCHLPDYESPATTPNHVMAGMSTDCASCHRPVTWVGARYVHQTFVRRGVHLATDCSSCHPGDDFTGGFNGRVAGFECAACHGPAGPVESWPDDHRSQGYPTTCELCHTELGWTPAKRPR